MPAYILLRLRNFYHACGYFNTTAAVLTKERQQMGARGVREAAADFFRGVDNFLQDANRFTALR